MLNIGSFAAPPRLPVPGAGYWDQSAPGFPGVPESRMHPSGLHPDSGHARMPLDLRKTREEGNPKLGLVKPPRDKNPPPLGLGGWGYLGKVEGFGAFWGFWWVF